MALYAGIDLHSNFSQLGVIDDSMKRLLKKRLRNEGDLITAALAPYRHDLAGVVVESTYNWYWLVDLLQEQNYRVHLANPTAIQKYKGLKHADDVHDAFWLAELLKLNILPEGYIYPKETRPLRDLLRKRQQLVRFRTALVLSLQNIVLRNTGTKLSASQLKDLDDDPWRAYLEYDPELLLAGRCTKDSIDCLTLQIEELEAAVEGKLRVQGSYTQLLSLPGVGRILASTMMLETGPISRFPRVGCYASYCRKVSSEWTSNEKLKGRGNRKNGNKYLAWAFSEAAESARRSHPGCREFYQRKVRQKKVMVAHNALAHKLARAAFYMLRDNVPFQEEKMFGVASAPLYN